mgnify:CR=1 FL=1
MRISIRGKLMSLYKKPDFRDKDSGEITPGKHNLEILVEAELSNGSIKHDMKISVFQTQRLKSIKLK